MSGPDRRPTGVPAVVPAGAPEAGAVLAELDRAMAAAAGATGALSAVLTAGAGARPDELLAQVRRQQAAAETVRADLADVVRRLQVLGRREEYRRRFGADGWPGRRAAVAGLAPGLRAAAYLAAWTDALLAGRFDEAGRWCAEPPELPAAYGWLPERLAEALAGVRERGPAARLAPAARFLAAGAVLPDPTGGGTGTGTATAASGTDASGTDASGTGGGAALSGGQRAGVLVLWARSLGLGADPDPAAAEDALVSAEGLAAGVVAEVRAARAALARRAGGDGPEVGADTVAGAVELVHRAAAGPDADPELVLAAARQAVARLTDPDGLDGRLDVLVEPAPAEFWVAAAGRLAADGDRSGAAALLDRAWAPNPVLAAEIADLRAELADPPDADLLVEAARTAIWAGRTGDSVAAYEQALAIEPGHAQASFGLADALLVSTNDAPLRQVVDTLQRVLRLCAGPREADSSIARPPVGPADAWTLLVEAGACVRLAGTADPGRTRWLWRGLGAAVRAVTYTPDSAAAWSMLATAFGGLQQWRAAQVASGYAYLLAPDQPTVQEARLIGLVNAGHMDAARELLAALGLTEPEPGGPPPDPRAAWLHAIESFAREHSGDLAGARRHAEAAVAAGPEVLLYRRLAGTACLLLGDRPAAEAHWRVVWREARDDEWEGLSMAAWAALQQGLLAAATELADRLVALEHTGLDEGDGSSVLGIARLLAGQTGPGRAALRSALGRTSTVRQVQDLFRLLPALGVSAVDVAALTADRDAAYGRLTARDGQPAGTAAVADLAELDPPGDRDRPARAAAQVLCLLAAGDPAGDRLLADLPDGPEVRLLREHAAGIRAVVERGGPVPAGAGPQRPAEPPKLRLALPASLFTDVPDPLRTHELFVRLLPDARSRTGTPLPAINVVADRDVDPDRFEVDLPDGPYGGTLPPPGTYAPAAAAALVPGAEPWSGGLVRLPATDDLLAAWLARSPVEVALRRVADEYARRQLGTTPA